MPRTSLPVKEGKGIKPEGRRADQAVPSPLHTQTSHRAEMGSMLEKKSRLEGVSDFHQHTLQMAHHLMGELIWGTSVVNRSISVMPVKPDIQQGEPPLDPGANTRQKSSYTHYTTKLGVYTPGGSGGAHPARLRPHTKPEGSRDHLVTVWCQSRRKDMKRKEACLGEASIFDEAYLFTTIAKSAYMA